MATVIDSFFVAFGIDPKPYAGGSEEIRQQNKRTRDQIEKSDKELQAGAKRNREAISGLKNEVTGLFLAFAGASSLKSFFGSLVQGDAATGRLAANLGVATTELGAWQLAAQRAGGSAEDANAAFSTLVRGFQQYKLTGSTGFNDDLRGLGVTLDDLNKPASALLKIAEAGERMDRAEFFTRLSNIGIPASVITTLAQGKDATRALVDQMERQYAVTKRNTDDAAKLDAALADLEQRIKEAVRPAVYGLVEGLLKFNEEVDGAKVTVPILVGVLGSLAAATVVAVGPWLALAGGITAAVLAMNKLLEVSPRVVRFLDLIETPLRAILPASMFERPGQTAAPATGKSVMNWGTGAKASGGDADYLRRAGIPEHVIRGVLAGLHAESGGDAGAVNPKSGAYGLAQWLGPRKTALFKRYGNKPTRQEQLEFLVDELRGGDPGGKAVLGAGSADGALAAFIRQFERPAAGAETEGDLRRGRAYLAGARPGATVAGGRTSTSTSQVSIGQITVYTPGTDAAGIARDLPGAINRRMTTANANAGLD